MTFPGKKIFQEYIWWFTALILFTLVTTVLETVSIGTAIPVLNILLNREATGDEYGVIVEMLYKVIHQFPESRIFILLCFFYLAMTFFKVISKFFRDSLKAYTAHMISTSCQKKMFTKVMASDLKYFIDNQSGDLVFRLTTLPQQIAIVFMMVPSIFIESMNVLFFCILLFTVSPKIFGMVVVIGVIYIALVSWISKKFFDDLGRQLPEVMAEQNVLINEMLGGIRDIIVYGRHEQWQKLFFNKCHKYLRLRRDTIVGRLIPENSFEFFVVAGACTAGAVYGGAKTTQIVDMLPVLTVYLMVLLRMMPAIARIGQERMRLATRLPSLTMYENFLEEPSIFRPNGIRPFEEFKDKIIFDKATFGYVDGQLVFDQLDLAFPKGKTIAIVGGSGVGKTTLVDLFLGLYQLKQGKVVVDGVDLADYDINTVRKNVGIVAQNSFIFNTSVKSNIAFDLEHVDMERVKEAARLAGFADVVEGLKDGYDTLLGDRGYALSGGQRQRLAIARALYTDPDIMIFDEATSALDYRTEEMINEMVQALGKHKTIIILAHRLSTIKNADIIYVLKNKKVEQAGTHEELLQIAGEYSHLYAKGEIQ